jgi:hypothetical protein
MIFFVLKPNTPQIILQVSKVLTAGLETTMSAVSLFSFNRLPILGASFSPREFIGRLKSSISELSQLDFAWRMR